MIEIQVNNLVKSFEVGKNVLDGLTFQVDQGERVGLLGRNGAGKTTLFKILTGELDYDEGTVVVGQGRRVGLISQIPVYPAGYTVEDVLDTAFRPLREMEEEMEQLAARMERGEDPALLRRYDQLTAAFEAGGGYDTDTRKNKVCSGLQIGPGMREQLFDRLSGGEKTRVNLGRLILEDTDILLLDEPTNHLDMEAVEWLESFLLDFKGALVFVAHDRMFMDNVGTHVLYLGLSRPVFRKATYTQFLALQEEYNAQREREARALQDEINRKMAFVERFRAKATKARQAGSRQKMAKKLEKELEDYRPEPKRKELNFSWPEAPHSEKIVLAAADLAFHFPDGKSMWPPLTFTLYRGGRIALVGHNGCGKSTLLRILAGQLERCGGNLVTASQMRLGYYTQHQMDTLRPDTTVLGEIRRLSDPHTTEEELMSVLGLFLLGQEYFRLVLASLFLKRCNFLLLDEPTNHLDLESREALVLALQKFTGTLLMVAHDRWLLSQVGAEAWELNENGITVHAGFAAYDADRRARLAGAGTDSRGGAALSAAGLPKMSSEAAREVAPGFSREEQKRLKREQAEKRNALHKELKPLQSKYTALEEELARVLDEQSAVEGRLADPEVYADHSRSGELLKRFEDCKRRGEDLLEEMAGLEEKITAIKKQAESE